MSENERQQIKDLVRRRVIQMRANETEYQAAMRAAAKAGRTLSEWLREIMRKHS